MSYITLFLNYKKYFLFLAVLLVVFSLGFKYAYSIQDKKIQTLKSQYLSEKEKELENLSLKQKQQSQKDNQIISDLNVKLSNLSEVSDTQINDLKNLLDKDKSKLQQCSLNKATLDKLNDIF